jgi:hypothetical protein
MNIDDTEKTVYQELKDSFWQIIQMEKELSVYEEKIILLRLLSCILRFLTIFIIFDDTITKKKFME